MATKTGWLIVLDAGTGGLRAAVFDLHGRLAGDATADWPLVESEDDLLFREFDPERTWAAVAQATRQALRRADASPTEARAIAATSQRDGCVLLDAEGRELCCALNRDARGVVHADEIAGDFGEQVFQTTGRWPLGLGPLGRLWWLRRNRPRTYQRIGHILMIRDWLTYRMSGALLSEPTGASSSLLFDIHERKWAVGLAEEMDLPTSIFPPCVESGTVAGPLLPSAATDLGLPEGTPVVVGPADSQAAALGCGALEEGEAVIVAGTTMPVLMALSAPLLDPAHRLYTGVHALPDRWVLESNAGLAGAVYHWFARAFAGPDPDYERLEEEASAAYPGEVLASIGPSIADFSTLRIPPPSVFRFPFLGMMEEPPTRGAFARAILENIGFAAKANLEQLEALTGRKADALHLCGGLARSSLLARIVADVCERPVHVPVVREASWLGAAACAAVGAGIHTDLPSALQAMVRHEPPVEPSPRSRRYRRLYAHWRDLLEKSYDL
ncbi:MAG TPA: hypothetical protein G4O00_06580 [Thermoflexia bacterium]|jgi:autoinducer 2 (AI-2) kinase|nr:hypothetical protein [Thermoflexia bacterium]